MRRWYLLRVAPATREVRQLSVMGRRRRGVALSLLLVAEAAWAASIDGTIDSMNGGALQARLQSIATDRAKHYDCQISIGVQTSNSALTASSDSNEDARFVWGSVTKLLTGSAILRAVERGQLKSLDVRAAPLLDPALKAIGLGSMKDLFGPISALITVRHLGSMRSGVPDYDTAKPWPRPPKDPFRAMVYAAPSVEWDPAEILNVSWVAKGKLDFLPGTNTRYSSTNFVLLGLLLATLDPSAASWDAYDQATALDALPTARRKVRACRRGRCTRMRMDATTRGAPPGTSHTWSYTRRYIASPPPQSAARLLVYQRLSGTRDSGHCTTPTA